jgi:hypothetical protein
MGRFNPTLYQGEARHRFNRVMQIGLEDTPWNAWKAVAVADVAEDAPPVPGNHNGTQKRLDAFLDLGSVRVAGYAEAGLGTKWCASWEWTAASHVFVLYHPMCIVPPRDLA